MEKFSIDWVVDSYNYLFEFIETPEELVVEKHKEFLRLQPNASAKDFIWSLFNFLIIKVSKDSKDEYEMFQRQSMIYGAMYTFRRKYEDTIDKNLQQLRFEKELNSYESSLGYLMNVKIISGHCCDYCNSLDNKGISLEEAKVKQYLGSDKCTRESGCNCCYAYAPVRDKDGRLIPLD